MITKNDNGVVLAQTSAQLLDGAPIRELILLAGKDGVGKSSAIVSLAWYVEQMNPAAKFYVIDTENKFKSALRSFGADAPGNVLYYKTSNMNEVTTALGGIMDKHKSGDWLAVESMGPIWDQAQDLAYQAIVGVSKAEFLEKKGRGKGPIPQPDDFWKIAKGAYDGAFLDVIRGCEDMNIILTSIAKPIKADGGFIKESKDRKAFRIEVGMDANLSGSPTMPSIVETLCMLELNQGAVTCRVLRDNLSTVDPSRVEFEVPSRRDWAVTFWANCRS
jgi:hypothetical protein